MTKKIVIGVTLAVTGLLVCSYIYKRYKIWEEENYELTEEEEEYVRGAVGYDGPRMYTPINSNSDYVDDAELESPSEDGLIAEEGIEKDINDFIEKFETFFVGCVNRQEVYAQNNDMELPGTFEQFYFYKYGNAIPELADVFSQRNSFLRIAVDAAEDQFLDESLFEELRTIMYSHGYLQDEDINNPVTLIDVAYFFSEFAAWLGYDAHQDEIFHVIYDHGNKTLFELKRDDLQSYGYVNKFVDFIGGR